MNNDIFCFFSDHPDALQLYEVLEEKILNQIEKVQIKVSKSQISFYNKHLFACVSFARIRKKKDCPPVYIVVTFGLSHRAVSPRIEAVAEPYPNRWTHHVLLSSVDEMDEEFMDWIREAAAFSAAK